MHIGGGETVAVIDRDVIARRLPIGRGGYASRRRRFDLGSPWGSHIGGRMKMPIAMNRMCAVAIAHLPARDGLDGRQVAEPLGDFIFCKAPNQFP